MVSGSGLRIFCLGSRVGIRHDESWVMIGVQGSSGAVGVQGFKV